MQREVGFVVVVVVAVLVAILGLVVYLARLRERVRRLERKATPAEVMSRLAAAELGQTRLAFEMQTQARLAGVAQAQRVTELRALRDEFTTAHVEPRDTVAMPAPKPSNDGEAKAGFDPDPPMYAPRVVPMRPPALLAPLAHPDLIVREDHADEAARSRLGPDEQTPPRRGRAALLVPVFQASKDHGA
jgi:hypothetical protein